MSFAPCVLGAPEFSPDKYVSPSPDKPFKVDIVPVELKEDHDLPPIPEEFSGKENSFTLVQLVEIALKTNPSTRYQWELARARAADWAAERGAYYPTATGSAQGQAGKMPKMLGGENFFQAGLALNYLLLDFGGRSAAVRSAKSALLAANLDHDQALQDVLRNVPQAYYVYTGSKAMVKAREASLAEARTSLNAAEQRLKAGVATIADVLEARSNAQQAEYDLASSKGDVEISRGRLAKAIGWPANTRFDTAPENDNIPLKEIGNNVDVLISSARKHRADLNSARADIKRKEEAVRKARAAMLPQLFATGNFTYQRMQNSNVSGYYKDTGYYGGLQLQVPVFQGFALSSRLRSAKAELQAALSKLELKEEGIVEDVWSSFQNFRTSKDKLSAAKALLASASESYTVSSARYNAGATDIVELMTQQSQLANARAQLITTQLAYFNNYAELIHSVGAEFSMASPAEEIVPVNDAE